MVQTSVEIVKPGGTGRPALVISARPDPLPPSTSFMWRLPSAFPFPKKYTYFLPRVAVAFFAGAFVPGFAVGFFAIRCPSPSERRIILVQACQDCRASAAAISEI